MGYDAHITRKAQWITTRGPKISAEEWRAFVAAEPDLRWYPDVEDRDDRGVEIVDSLGDVVGVIYWDRGDVKTKNPNGELLGRMIEIADKLDARVMGDDGETYRDSNRPHVSRPSYFNAKNLTNTWEEPPEGYDEAIRHEELANYRVQQAETQTQKVATNAPAVTSAHNPAVAASRWLFAVALAFAVLGGGVVTLMRSATPKDDASVAFVITTILFAFTMTLSWGVRRSKRWAIWGAYALAIPMLASIPIGTIVAWHLLTNLTKIKRDKRV